MASPLRLAFVETPCFCAQAIFAALFSLAVRDFSSGDLVIADVSYVQLLTAVEGLTLLVVL